MTRRCARVFPRACARGRQAKAASGSGGLLFEMQQGMVSRGASLKWLSQYPYEAEASHYGSSRH